MRLDAKSVTRSAIMAGLLATTPAAALAADAGGQTGTGQTDMVMTIEDQNEHGGTEDPTNPPIDPTNPNSPGANLSFTVPAVMNYVVRADGSLIGPTGDTAHVTNLSTFATHVSSLDVDPETPFSIVRDVSAADGQNVVDLTVGPQNDQLQAVDYLSKQAVNDPTQWNMTAANGQSQSDELPVLSSGHVARLTLGTSTDNTTQIPAEIQATGELNGQTLGVGHEGRWMGTMEALDSLVASSGPIHTLYQFYQANNGYIDPAGFERIGDRYIITLGQGPFKSAIADSLNVGDHVTVEFDDGTTIEAIIGDQMLRYGVTDPYDPDCWNEACTVIDPQGRSEMTCGWGSVNTTSNEIASIEFFGANNSMYDPMDGPIQTSSGGSMSRITKITDHGLYADYAQYAHLDESLVEGTPATTKFGEIHWYLTPGATI